MKTKVISITIAILLFLGMAAVSFTTANAATATEPTGTAASTGATTDSATRDSATPDSANGSIPTGDNGAVLCLVGVSALITAGLGVAYFAKGARKNNR